MNLDNQLEQLRVKVSADRQQREQAATTTRATAWTRIQTEAPDVAALLTAVNATFGKPASVRVRIGGERVL